MGRPLVAVVGRANVGKSTLFNRLLRSSRSLVEDRPGVTRDRVAADAVVEGRDVLLVDTGGLDPEAEEGIPSAIRHQVEQVVEEAAVVVLVVDARSGLLPLDEDIADVLRRAEVPVVVAVNKADGPHQDSATGDFYGLGFEAVVPTSAEHRRGIVDLEISIARRLPPVQEIHAPHDGAVRVAIVGRPNVGKSSLLNRLIGDERAIVADEPGTTRDASDTRLRLGERDLVLIDTAGLRRPGRRRGRLERGSAFMALRSIERAEVALVVLDAAEGITDQDARVARLALDRGRPLVLVCNKWDAVEPGERQREIERQLDRRLGFVPDAVICHVSAKTGRGTHKLLPEALALVDGLKRRVATSDVNRVLAEAVRRYAPPMTGRRRARFFYATQVSEQPFTVIVFVSDPSMVAKNYRRYLESFFRKAFEIRSAPVRLVLRERSRGSQTEEIGPDSGSRRRPAE